MIELEFIGMERLSELEGLWDVWWPDRVLRLTAEALVEDAALRLEDDVLAPDGSPWDEWSTEYAKTRKPQHKLLWSTGALAESLKFQQRGQRYMIGSELEYALVHQEGSNDGTIKPRPYVGVSDELEAALQDIYETDFDRAYRRAVA